MYNNFSSKKTKKVISALLASALVVTSAPITADAATTKVLGVKKTFTVAGTKVTGLSKTEKKVVKVTIKNKKVTVKGLKAGKVSFKIGKETYNVNVGATKVTATAAATTLKVNDKTTVAIKATNGAKDNLTIKTSKSSVVKIGKSSVTADKNGKASVTLRGLAAGTSTITVKSANTGMYAKVKITVKADETATAAPSSDAPATLAPATDAPVGPTVVPTSGGAVTTAPTSGGAVTAAPTATPSTVTASAIVSAEVVSAKAIKVTFAKAVSGGSIELKNGNATVSTNLTWNNDKTVAVLTSAAVLQPATYTVVATGVADETLQKTVVVSAQTIASIEIKGNEIIKATNGASAYFYYEVKDQYGDDITTDIAASNFTLTSSVGTVSLTPADKKGVITYDFTTANAPTDVIVSILHNATGKFSNKALVVSKPATLASFELGTVILPTGSNHIYENTTNAAKISFVAKDNYGNEIVNPSADITLASSDSTLVEPSFQLDTTDNKYYITLTTSGLSTLDKEVTITAIGKTAGIVLQKTIKVEKVATPSKVVFGAINKAVVAVGDTVAIDVTVYDQFGDVMTPDKYVSSGIVLGKTGALASATSVEFDVDKTSKTYGKVLLNTAAAAVNNGSVTATLGTTTFTKDITVKDARVVSSVIKANDVTLIQGARKKLAFKFQDQYGEEIETVADNSTANTGYSVTITKNSGDDAGLTKELTSGINESELNDIEVFSVANATGKYTVTVALTNANGTIASATTVVTVVSDVAEGLTYSIVDLKTVVADATHTVDGTDPYAQVITIKATDANGNEVVIPPKKIISVDVEGTNASTYFQVGSVDESTPDTKVDAQEGQYVLAAKAKAVEATAKDAVVVAQINTSKGIQLVKSNVLTFTNEAPKAVEFFLTDGDAAPSFVGEPTKFVGGKTSFTFANTVDPSSLNENLYLVQKDQYGVYKTISASNMALTVNTPNSIVGTVKLNEGKIQGTISDYSVNKDITLSFVSGGVAKTFTVKFEKTIGDVTASLNDTTLTFSRDLSAASAAKVITQLESDESIASVTTNNNKVFTIAYAAEKNHSNIDSSSLILNKSDVIDICGNASVANVTITDNTGA